MRILENYLSLTPQTLGFSGNSTVKNLPAGTGEVEWIPGSGRSVGHREVAEISKSQKCGEFFLLSDSSVVIYEGKPIIYTALSGRLIFFPLTCQ